jgi:hypothetical protein
MKRIFQAILMLSANLLMGQQLYSDAANAMVICSKEPVVVATLPGPGKDIKENTGLSCYKEDFLETNAVWLKWKVQNSGSLGFTILPLNEQDDIDFVLYKLDAEWTDFKQRSVVRCMTAGKNYGESDQESSYLCTGATGLRNSESDFFESPGCHNAANNFLAEIQATQGEMYLLFINNYHSSNGVLIEFNGDATFSDAPTPCSTATTQTEGLNNILHSVGLTISPVYPNPAKSQLWADINSDMPLDGVVQLINAQGVIVHSEQLRLIPDKATYSISTEALRTGVYFIKFRFGDHVMVQRFVRA